MLLFTRVLINSLPPLVGGVWLLFFGARPGRYGTLGDYHYRILQLEPVHGCLLIGGWLLLGAGLGSVVAGIARRLCRGEFRAEPDSGDRFIWENNRFVMVVSVSGVSLLAVGTILFGNP